MPQNQQDMPANQRERETQETQEPVRHRRLSVIALPKEMIWPVCQRFFLVLFVMCGTVLAIRLQSMWKMGKLGSWSRIDNRLQVNGTRFFLDIGSGNHGFLGFSHTMKLEEKGWRGVCADPFPDHERACTTLSEPVTPERGQQVQLRDCRGQDVALMSSPSKCRQVHRKGLAVTDVLKLAKAPRIIDYVNLDTEGLELGVLKTFPFKDFCVRSWSVQHRNESAVAVGAQELLEANGCSVLDTGSSHWAKCSCKPEILIKEILFPESVVAKRGGHPESDIPEGRIPAARGSKQSSVVRAPSNARAGKDKKRRASSLSLQVGPSGEIAVSDAPGH